MKRSANTFKRTDSGNAERLVARYGKEIRFCPARRQWLHFDGRRWKWDALGYLQQLAKNTVRAIYEEARKVKDDDERKAIAQHALHSEKRERRAAMLSLAETEPGIAISPQDLDSDPWLFNVQNGAIDLRNGELRPHDRNDLLTKIAPVDYAPEARSEVWDRFIEDVTGGDPELAAYLQRIMGYSMQGRVTEKKFWFFFGPPDGMKARSLLRS